MLSIKTFDTVNKPSYKVGIKATNEMSADGLLELYFIDAIYNKTSVNWFTGEETEESLLAEVIDKVNSANPTKVVCCIDSWGGSCDVGLGIYNYLRSKNIKRETKILNSCASIATVIAASGDKGKVLMPRNGIMVIHQAAITVSGNVNDMREAINILDTYTNNILDVYVQNNRKGKTRDELFALIKDGDYWMTGTKAKEMGFVDDTYNDESITVTNSIEKAKEFYNKIPSNIQAIADAEKGGDKKGIKKILNQFKMEVANIINDFKASLPKNEAGTNISNMLEAPLTNVLNSVKESITNEISTARTEVNEAVTNRVNEVENAYKEVLNGIKESVTEVTNTVVTLKETIDTQNETITAQATTIKNLKNDILRMQGKQAASAGSETVENETGQPKTFAGRVKYS